MKEQTTKATGIDILDALPPEERRQVKRKLKEHWNSLSQEQRAEHMTLVYDMLREKIREHGGMISQKDALKEFINKDVPVITESIAKEMEGYAAATGEKGYLGVAKFFREARWGLDPTINFDVRIVDEQKQQAEISYSYLTPSPPPPPASSTEEEGGAA